MQGLLPRVLRLDKELVSQSRQSLKRPAPTSGDSDLLAAFDRAIKAAVAHAKNCPEDKHHVWALRRGLTTKTEKATDQPTFIVY
eukprot:4912600-Amphidinium_carterae.1